MDRHEIAGFNHIQYVEPCQQSIRHGAHRQCLDFAGLLGIGW
jgi:hypothetical protein